MKVWFGKIQTFNLFFLPFLIRFSWKLQIWHNSNPSGDSNVCWSASLQFSDRASEPIIVIKSQSVMDTGCRNHRRADRRFGRKINVDYLSSFLVYQLNHKVKWPQTLVLYLFPLNKNDINYLAGFIAEWMVLWIEKMGSKKFRNMFFQHFTMFA